VAAEAEQQGFAPAGRTVEVVVVQMLHLVGLHLHERGLGEFMTLLAGQIDHVLGSGSPTDLFAHLRIGLHE
jgi:hypothetical protein